MPLPELQVFLRSKNYDDFQVADSKHGKALFDALEKFAEEQSPPPPPATQLFPLLFRPGKAPPKRLEKPALLLSWEQQFTLLNLLVPFFTNKYSQWQQLPKSFLEVYEFVRDTYNIPLYYAVYCAQYKDRSAWEDASSYRTAIVQDTNYPIPGYAKVYDENCITARKMVADAQAMIAESPSEIPSFDQAPPRAQKPLDNRSSVVKHVTFEQPPESPSEDEPVSQFEVINEDDLCDVPLGPPTQEDSFPEPADETPFMQDRQEPPKKGPKSITEAHITRAKFFDILETYKTTSPLKYFGFISSQHVRSNVMRSLLTYYHQSLSDKLFFSEAEIKEVIRDACPWYSSRRLLLFEGKKKGPANSTDEVVIRLHHAFNPSK